MQNFILLICCLFLTLYSCDKNLVGSYSSKVSIRTSDLISYGDNGLNSRLKTDDTEMTSVDVQNRKKKRATPKFDLHLPKFTNESDTRSIFDKEGDIKYDLSFTVYGEPIPLSRHMVARGRMYNPSAKAQKLFSDACADKLPTSPMDGPIEANLIFYFSRPKNHYGTGKNFNKLKDNIDTWHSKKKDLDNLIKFVLDSLNRKAYLDDSQICIINSAKLYTNSNARIEIRMRKLSSIKIDT